MGLIFVYLLMQGANSVMPFEMFLSAGNAIFGVGISVFVGVLSGIIPAILASNLDPVETMRK